MKRSRRGRPEKAADVETKIRHLPLAGKVIYLDVKDHKQVRTLEHKIKKLGATVERFLSKEVNYVISYSAPVRSQSQATSHQDGQGPESPAFANTPSPFSAVPSPSTAGQAGADGKFVPMPRGKTMAQIACGVRSPSPSGVVASAEKLGIKIVSLEGAQKWLDKELHKLGQGQDETGDQGTTSKKKKSAGSGYVKCRRLHQPYLKVEAASQHYRPVYRELPVWPHPNVDTPASTCPFDGRGVAEARRSVRGDRDGQASVGNWASPKSQSGTQRRSRSGEDSSRLLGLPILTAEDLRRQREKRKQAQRRRGYCECCGTKYDDIDEHVKEKSHRDFVRDKQNYEALDGLISKGPSTVRFLHSILLRHCKEQWGNRPSGSCVEDDSSNDVVLTVDLSTPVKEPPSTAVPAGIPEDQGTKHPGFQTPTRRLECTAPANLHEASPQRRRRKSQKEGFCGGGVDSAAGHADDTAANLQAVVIRRPGAKNVYHSPRRSVSRGGVAKVKERSLVFGHSPIGSLQALTSGEKSAALETMSERQKRLKNSQKNVSSPENSESEVNHAASHSQSLDSAHELTGGVSVSVKLQQPVLLEDSHINVEDAKQSFSHSALNPESQNMKTRGLTGAQPVETKLGVDIVKEDIASLANPVALRKRHRSRTCKIKHDKPTVGGVESATQMVDGGRPIGGTQGMPQKQYEGENYLQKKNSTASPNFQATTLVPLGSQTAGQKKRRYTNGGECSSASVFSGVLCLKPERKLHHLSSSQHSKNACKSTDQTRPSKTRPVIVQESIANILSQTASGASCPAESSNSQIQNQMDESSKILSSPKPLNTKTLKGGKTSSQMAVVPERKPNVTKSEKSHCNDPDNPDNIVDEVSSPTLPQGKPQKQKAEYKTPEKDVRLAVSSFQSVTPKSQKKIASLQSEECEDEECASPVFPRSLIHCSTPVVVITKKLRHVLSSQDVVCQDTEEGFLLTEQPKKPQTRRSIFQEGEVEIVSRPDDGEQLKSEGRKLSKSKKRPKDRGKQSNVNQFQKKNKKADLQAVNSQALSTNEEVSAHHRESVTVPQQDVTDAVPVSTTKDSAQICVENTAAQSSFSTQVSTKKKVKLNGSWLLLSDRSMSRLLLSDSDNDSPFPGFTGHEDDGLSSSLSYEEASEVEVSDTEEHEWIFDKSGSSELDMNTLRSFIPTFSSPGRQSESSWGDTCDLYLSLSVQKRLENTELRRSPRRKLISPKDSKKRKRSRSRRKDKKDPDSQPAKKSRRERSKETDKHTSRGLSWDAHGVFVSGMHTPTKRNLRNADKDKRGECERGVKHGKILCRVDEEVMFNYGSPQKSNTAFSPLRIINGVVGAGITEKMGNHLSPSTKRPLKLD